MNKEYDVVSLLKEFVDDIEATGGVMARESGLFVPLGDPEWIDLGELYIKACKALAHKPLIVGRKGKGRY